MRASFIVLFGLALLGCKDKELQDKLAASEARAAAAEGKSLACEAQRTALQTKVDEQERAIAAAKAETATLRTTLPPITTKPSSARPPPKAPASLGF